MSSIAQPVARSVSRSVLAGQRMNLGYLIRSMFSNSEQGFAYDINDLSTLFQDAAGTIPVTAAGQPVGLVLDKSKGLVLGGERVTGGNFEGGLIGSKSDGLGSVSTWELNTVSPISGTKDGKLSITTPASGRPILSFSTPVKTLGALYEITFDYKVLSGAVSIFGVYNGATTSILNTTLSGSGKFRARYTALAAVADDLIYFGNSAGTIQIDNISIKQVLGNHAYQTTSSMRPLLQRNATTGAYYLAFDGTDDFLVSSSIDFTATDKVSLFAGVRKLSDVQTGIIIEFSQSSAANNGSFHLAAPESANGNNYQVASRGTVRSIATTPSTYIPPVSNIVSAFCWISSDTAKIRINGTQVVTIAIDQGTGNYGNYPLYIGRRGGTSYPFNGHLYSLIGVARLSADAETTNLEKAIAKNVGVTL